MVTCTRKTFLGMIRSYGPSEIYMTIGNKLVNIYLPNNILHQKSIEKDYGVRYSALLELPYWNPITFAVVDLMHNLFLGIGKHVMQVWIDRGILNKNDFQVVEQMLLK